METANLLGAEQRNTDVEHPFLPTKSVDKASLVSSSTYKTIMFILVSFIITIFVGFLIGSNIIPDASDIKQNNIESPFSPTLSSQSALVFNQMPQSTLTPTAGYTAKPTKKPTNKPSKSPTRRPTTATSKKPTNKPTTTTTAAASTTSTTTSTASSTTSSTASSTTLSTASSTTSSTSSSTTRIPTISPTKHTTTKSPTAAPFVAIPNKPLDIVPLKGAMNENVLFQSQVLSTDLAPTELFQLEINIDIITVNEEEGFMVQNTDVFHGPNQFNYKYPTQETDEYETNEIRRTCYNFKFRGTSSFNNALIMINFNRFDLENGFDRILIRHFNKSFIDVPLSYTGHHSNLSKQYLLEKGTSKSVCIEFQSDESITKHGIDYALSVVYDVCKWSNWSECYAMDLRGKRWTRGPFMNGKCGLGITSKHRLDNKKTSSHLQNGFLAQCTNGDILNESGPEYCLKRTCGDYDNYNDSDFDAASVPGQGWYNISRYYNGAGRIDPDPNYADPFRIYTSTNTHINLANPEWLNILRHKLINKTNEIVAEHENVGILEHAILDTQEHRDTSAEYLGAKVLYSLINGAPFIAALTGDSVTSGHDNMFMSSYPMQLQSRLRKWWLQNGNKGAAFLTRNYGVGGGPASDSQGFMPVAMVTETFPHPFSKLNGILQDNYDIWYRSAFPVHKVDLETFEYHFTEGRGTQSSRELHLRESASLGAIWAVIQPIVGVTNEWKACRKWKDLNKTMMRDWSRWQRNKKYAFVSPYLKKMGVAAIDPNYGMQVSCPLYKKGTLRERANSNDEDDGLPPNGRMYAYTPWWLKVNWHPNSRGHRVMSDVLSYWILHSAITFIDKYKSEIDGLKDAEGGLQLFLKSKSGNWKAEIKKSIMNKKYDEFVEADYCGVQREKAVQRMSQTGSKTFGSTAMQYNDYCESIPFALTNARPTIYNTHNLLNEYIYARNNETVYDWNSYIAHAGWQWTKSDTIISIDRKLGTEGNMDIFHMLKPKSAYFADQFKEWKKNNDNDGDDLEGFHQYLIDNENILQFVVKTPKFGSGAIKAFNGFNCDKDLIQLMHVYVKKLDAVDVKQDLGQLIKSTDCIVRDLELNTKYIVTYVPYNISSDLSKYFVMFLVAF